MNIRSAGRGLKALNNRKNWKKLWIPIVGFASLIWFLIRVIPKPSRAAYPCQQAAFPIASAFVLWVAGFIPVALFIRKAKKSLRNARYLPGLAFMFLALISYGTFRFAVSGTDISLKARNIAEQFIPTDDPNSPMGTARGLSPGRVVWNHDPDATSWDEENGYFWDDDNTSQTVVNNMLSETIDGYSGATSNWDSWNALFESFNMRKGKGSVDYQEGEKIAIKINLNASTTHNNPTHLRAMPSPQLILALVTQLVDNAGVPDSCITVYDNSKLIPAMIYDKCIAAHPGLRFVDRDGGDGREKFKTDSSSVLDWSEDLVLEPGGGFPTYLPECVSKADYLLNIGVLKGHTLAGISGCGKNHCGTILSTNPEKTNLTPPRAAGFHAYASVHYFEPWDIAGRDMETYNTVVDMMGHKSLGENTMLFIIDGLYAAKAQGGNDSQPNKWISEPFNNDWTSSIFISQDNVALESVCLDFLRSEPTQVNVYGNVDNYLHEAALAHDPPSGTFYDPEGDSIRLGSLGVHEHWNNASDKQYTRNLGTGEGIELLALGTKFMGDLTLSVPPGTYDDSVKVGIQSEVEDVNIHYTLDGSIPNQFSDLYTGEIIISDNSVLNAIAYKEGYVPSSMITGLYIITKNIGDLTLSVAPGTYDDSVAVGINSEVESVNIFYTLDGSIPNQSSSAYNGEIIITDNSVLNAIAYKEGYVQSSMITGSYIITKYIGDLTLSVAPGTYDDSVAVGIISEVESVNIFYTLDGSIPNQSSSAYTGEIIITDNSVLNAIAYKEGYTSSSVVNGSYTIRNTTGIMQFGQNGIKVYPTLVSDALNLQILNDRSGDYNFRIYDYSGKLVKSLSLRKTTFNTTEYIDLSDLNSGSYIVIVQQGKSRSTTKIVKQ